MVNFFTNCQNQFSTYFYLRHPRGRKVYGLSQFIVISISIIIITEAMTHGRLVTSGATQRLHGKNLLGLPDWYIIATQGDKHTYT